MSRTWAALASGDGVIPQDMAGQRIDARSPPCSRRAACAPAAVAARGHDRCRRRTPRASDKVRGGEQVTLDARQSEETSWDAEEVSCRVVYEDEALIVVDKPAGLVVHPGAGNPAGTLVNGLLHRAPELAAVPRGGIVHRLDKETSGLLVVARTLAAHKALVDQLQERSMGREYEAVACGMMTAGGTVDMPIGRHPRMRTRMAVTERGKPAVTHYRVVERFAAHTWLRVKLETGRTHQIRVHMAHIRHPLVGDPEYGGRLRLPAEATEELRSALRGFGRQALHAAQLSLLHPLSGEQMEWAAPLPADLSDLIAALRRG